MSIVRSPLKDTNSRRQLCGCCIGVTASVSQNKSLLQFETGGNANVTPNVQNSFFNGSRTYGLFTNAAGSSTLNVTLNQSGFGTDVNAGAAVNQPGTTITNPPAIGLGITNSASALVDYTVTNNTFWSASGTAGAVYAVSISGASSVAGSRLNGSFSGNKIGKTGTTGSGCSGGCAGLGLLPGLGGTFSPTIANNDIRQTNSVGINYVNNVGAGASFTSSVRIKCNTIAEPDTTGSPALQRAIIVSPGNSGGANNTVCAEIGGAGALQNTISGAWQAGFFIRVTNNNNTPPMVMPGLSPISGATAAQVNAFIEGNNPSAVGNVGSAIGAAGINGSASPCP